MGIQTGRLDRRQDPGAASSASTPQGQTAFPTLGHQRVSGTNLTIGGPRAAPIATSSPATAYGIAWTVSPGALIQGNLVGTTASGDARLGNVFGLPMWHRHRNARDPRQRHLGERNGPSAATASSPATSAPRRPQLRHPGQLDRHRRHGHGPPRQRRSGFRPWATTTSPSAERRPARATSSPTTGAGSSMRRGTGATRRSAATRSSPTAGPSPASPLGIDLGDDGVTAERPRRRRHAPGANDLQNFPIIASAISSGGSTTSTERSTASPTRRSRSTSTRTPPCSVFPQGFPRRPDLPRFGGGHDRRQRQRGIDVDLPVTIEPGARVTATATSPDGNTSEFSQRIVFSSSPGVGSAAGGTPSRSPASTSSPARP